MYFDVIATFLGLYGLSLITLCPASLLQTLQEGSAGLPERLGDSEYVGDQAELSKRTGGAIEWPAETNELKRRLLSGDPRVSELLDDEEPTEEDKRAFQPWSGKRVFQPWSGKRAFNPWGGKRAFNPWSGKRSEGDETALKLDALEGETEEEKRAFNPWSGKRAFNPWSGKRAFNPWSGKRAFNPWSGKRAFNPWSGKRAFNPWSGKRVFNSWAGKRSGDVEGDLREEKREDEMWEGDSEPGVMEAIHESERREAAAAYNNWNQANESM